MEKTNPKNILRLYYSCSVGPSAICRSSTYLNLDVTKLQLYDLQIVLFLFKNIYDPTRRIN